MVAGDCIPSVEDDTLPTLPPISETVHGEVETDQASNYPESTLNDVSVATSVKSIRLPENAILGKTEYKEFKKSLQQSQRHRIIESRRRMAEEQKMHQQQLTRERQDMDHFERRVIRSFSERWAKQIPAGQKRPRGYSYSRAQSAGSISLTGSYRIATGAGSAVPHYTRNLFSRRSFSAGAILPSSCMKCSVRASSKDEPPRTYGRRWSNAGLPQVKITFPRIYLTLTYCFLHVFPLSHFSNVCRV